MEIRMVMEYWNVGMLGDEYGLPIIPLLQYSTIP